MSPGQSRNFTAKPPGANALLMISPKYKNGIAAYRLAEIEPLRADLSYAGPICHATYSAAIGSHADDVIVYSRASNAGP